MLREDIVSKALSYVGTKGWTMKSNWCARFVHDIYEMCGASEYYYNGKMCDSCTTLMNFYKNKYPSQCHKDINRCKPGDLVFFQFDKDAKADHIGIFQQKISSTKFKTVEGNTRRTDLGNQSDGGWVANRTRKKSQVMLFVHIVFDDDLFNPYPEPTRTIYKGCKGDDVKWVQFILKNLGYGIEVDGSFGSKSENATMVYQQVNGLTPDGRVGAKTRKCLEGEEYGR